MDSDDDIADIKTNLLMRPALPEGYTYDVSVSFGVALMSGKSCIIECIGSSLLLSLIEEIEVKLEIPRGIWFGPTARPQRAKLLDGAEELRVTVRAEELSDRTLTAVIPAMPHGATEQFIVSSVGWDKNPDAVFEQMCTQHTRRLYHISSERVIVSQPNSRYKTTARRCIVEPNPQAQPGQCAFCTKLPCTHGARCTRKNFRCNFCHRGDRGSCDVNAHDWRNWGSLLRQIGQ